MRIGLISDTHVPGGATEVPPQVATAFEGVDLILHAGNIYRTGTLDWLERIAPVKAAGAIYGDRMEHPDGLCYGVRRRPQGRSAADSWNWRATR